MSMHLAWPTCMLFFNSSKKIVSSQSFVYIFQRFIVIHNFRTMFQYGSSVHMAGKLVLMMVGRQLTGGVEESTEILI
jgi:hypothetical protein